MQFCFKPTAWQFGSIDENCRSGCVLFASACWVMMFRWLGVRFVFQWSSLRFLSLPSLAGLGWQLVKMFKSEIMCGKRWECCAWIFVFYSSSGRNCQSCSFPCCSRYWYLSFPLPDFSIFFCKDRSSVCMVNSMDALVQIRPGRQNTSHSFCPEIRWR